jgi:ElaB/YqjD/DUF883 family membrane-anchored ribosome-binding protein
MDTARHNPLAMGLIGTGLAMLAAGVTRAGDNAGHAGRDDAASTRQPVGEDDFGPSHADYDPRVRPTSPGLAASEPRMAGFDERVAAAERAAARDARQGDPDMHDPAIHPHDRSAGATAGRGMRNSVRGSARALRERLNDGLDRMPDEARRRVVRARLAAIEAQHEVERQLRHSADYARHTARENPLMLGALALGIGAAIGAALPRTSAENHAVGAYRDRMMDEADRIFREEASKYRRVAEAAVAEGKSAVKDTLESGPPTEDDPARRVSRAAQDEAKRQKVGSVS